MSNLAKNCISTVIPSMRYRDAVGMIAWLERAFGFQKQAVYMSGENTVAHAQLTFGNGMVMVGSIDNKSEIAPYMAQPDELGNRETRSAYLVVTDCGPSYVRAKAAGAKMILDLRDMDYGGQAFTCADPEGHMWSFGTYDPWVET